MAEFLYIGLYPRGKFEVVLLEEKFACYQSAHSIMSTFSLFLFESIYQ